MNFRDVLDMLPEERLIAMVKRSRFAPTAGAGQQLPGELPNGNGWPGYECRGLPAASFPGALAVAVYMQEPVVNRRGSSWHLVRVDLVAVKGCRGPDDRPRWFRALLETPPAVLEQFRGVLAVLEEADRRARARPR